MVKSKASCFWALLFIIYIVTIVRSLFGFDASDESSYAAAAYSLTKGSRLFLDCWDVHQTSALILAPLISLYEIITGGTVGILLFLRMIYCTVAFLLGMLVFRILSEKCTTLFQYLLAFAASVLIQLVSPASVSTFSYNTLAVLFLILASFALVYQNNQKHFVILRFVGSGACFSAAVQAYPFMVLTLPAFVAMVLIQHPSGRKRHRLQLSALWIAGALLPVLVFLTVLIAQGDVAEAFASIPKVLTDPEHGESGSFAFLTDYRMSVNEYLGLPGACLLFVSIGSALLARLPAFPRMVSQTAKVLTLVTLFAGLIEWTIAVLFSDAHDIVIGSILQYGLALFLPALMILCWRGFDWAACLWLVGMLASVAGQLGSNVGFDLSSYFAVIASIGALSYLVDCHESWSAPDIPLCCFQLFRLVLAAVLCFNLTVLFYSRVMAVYRDEGIPNLGAMITRGPAAGLYTTPRGKQWYDDCYEALSEHSGNAESIFIGVLFPTGYLMTDSEVMAPRVWRTALNAEDLRDWFSLHPEKGLPDVVFIKSNELWEYDRYPDDQMDGIVGEIISSGDYREINTDAGKLFVRE